MNDEKAVAEEMRRNATERLSVKRKKVKDADSGKDEPGPFRRKSLRSLVEIMEQRITNPQR